MRKVSKDLEFTTPQYWIVFLAFCIIALFTEFISINVQARPAEFHFAHWGTILRSFIGTLLDNSLRLALTVVIYIHFISRKSVGLFIGLLFVITMMHWLALYLLRNL